MRRLLRTKPPTQHPSAPFSPRRAPDNENAVKDNGKPIEGAQGKSSLLDTLVWILIGIILALTGVWTLWAAHQPRLTSIWAPE
jgi:multisubunit Na+/H+ antiporter MnhB subunit